MSRSPGSRWGHRRVLHRLCCLARWCRSGQPPRVPGRRPGHRLRIGPPTLRGYPSPTTEAIMATPMRHVSGGLCLAAAAALFAGASWGIPWGSSIAGGPRPGEGDMFVPRGTQRTDRAPHIPRWSHAPERVRAGGALRPVIANSHLTGRTIALEVTWKALGDLLSLQARLVLVENIQKTVADYCDVPLADLLPKRGRRLVARPRELAMALAKELTHLVCPGLAMPSAAAITPPGGRLTRGPKSFGAKATGVPRGTGGRAYARRSELFLALGA